MNAKSSDNEFATAEGRNGLTEMPDGDVGVSEEDVQRVAAAGQIPDDGVQSLRGWLHYVLLMHRTNVRVLKARIPTGASAEKQLTAILNTSQRLNRLLSASWVKSAMQNHEWQKAWEATDGGAESKIPPIEYSGLLYGLELPRFEHEVLIVDEDFLAVKRLQDRSSEMLKKCDHLLNDPNSQEDVSDVPSTALRLLTVSICSYWDRGLGLELTVEQKGPFPAFAGEVFRLAGCPAKTWETLRSRLKEGTDH